MSYSYQRNSRDDEDEAQKITIIAGPTFGEAMKFVLLGALLGAGATYSYLQGKPQPLLTPDNAPRDAKTDAKVLTARLGKVSERLKNVAGGAAAVAKSAALTAAPLVSQAVVEGRRAAQETQSEMERDLEAAKNEAQSEAARIKIERAAREK